jgi:hypothetical protein
MDFQITFDGRNSNFPKSREEAIARARAYAHKKGVDIPVSTEALVSDVEAWGRRSGLLVAFEWSDDTA